MTRRDPLTRIHHMLDHSLEAVEMVGDRTRNDLDVLWTIMQDDLGPLIV
jgi:hypothetical protein